MNTTNRPLRVVVVGGSLGGLLAGNMLLRIGCDVTVHERVGVELAAALLKLFPGKFEIDASARLFGSTAGLARLKAGDDPATIAASWSSAEGRWRLLRGKYLLY